MLTQVSVSAAPEWLWPKIPFNNRSNWVKLLLSVMGHLLCCAQTTSSMLGFPSYLNMLLLNNTSGFNHSPAALNTVVLRSFASSVSGTQLRDC